jgi:hypothetical protein
MTLLALPVGYYNAGDLLQGCVLLAGQFVTRLFIQQAKETGALPAGRNQLFEHQETNRSIRGSQERSKPFVA